MQNVNYYAKRYIVRHLNTYGTKVIGTQNFVFMAECTIYLVFVHFTSLFLRVHVRVNVGLTSVRVCTGFAWAFVLGSLDARVPVGLRVPTLMGPDPNLRLCNLHASHKT